jgi:hypothetical protein
MKEKPTLHAPSKSHYAPAWQAKRDVKAAAAMADSGKTQLCCLRK